MVYSAWHSRVAILGFLRHSDMTLQQGRIQSVWLEGAISMILGDKSHNVLATVREIKYTSKHCCNKTMDDKMTLLFQLV